MAGIGFELKKLFSQKGILAGLRAYGYAGIVCTGPMLLGVVLLLGIRFIADAGGAGQSEQMLLVAMTTYALLFSLVLSSLFSMITTRFTADMLYMGKTEWILPSFYGSTSILIIIGTIGYGIFLFFSGVPFIYRVLCFTLFSELIVVWTQINYMTALKDYRSILLTFAAGVVIALLSGFLLAWMRFEIISSMMAAASIGYGVIMVGFFILLHISFPRGQGSAFRFLTWVKWYPSLMPVGFFMNVGLFAHLVIMWFGPVGMLVKGLFYGAPQYDVPALVAFLSILPTMVNFVVSVEVNFYPKYKRYFSLVNGGGTVKDIELAENEMMTVLKQELTYLSCKQFVITILFIALSRPVLLHSGLGFNDTMLGTLRILCVGYGLYAIANSIMLIHLYFADDYGAFLISLVFMVCSVGGTLVLLNGSSNFYGYGFLLGGAAMYILAWLRLWNFSQKLEYHVFLSLRKFPPSRSV